jgi:hypothetical protein
MNDTYIDGKLSLVIMALIIILIVYYISYRKENKKTKGTFFVQKNNNNLNSNRSHNNTKFNTVSKDLNKLPSFYFRAIKYTLWGYLLFAIIVGLIVMALHVFLGLGVLILLVLVLYFAHKNYVKSLIYKGLTIEEQKIIINKYPPNPDQIILLNDVHKITFEDIYQKNGKGFDQKVGCEMVFWSKDDKMIDTFDVEKFKKSEQLKAAIFDRLSIS